MERRYVIFIYLGFALLLSVTLAKLSSSVAFWFDISDAGLIGNQFTATSLLGVVLGSGITAYAYARNDARQFCLDVVRELLKVAWPDRKSTSSATGTVIVTTLIVSGLLGVFDFTWRLLTGFIYR